MRQSQSYRRGQNGFVIDPNEYKTYRIAVASRIWRKKRTISMLDAWQLAAVSAWFRWVFRKPINYLKKKMVARTIVKKFKSNRESLTVE